MKAQSPDSRFRKTLNYSLTAYFLDCQTLESDPTMQTLSRVKRGGTRVYPLPAEPGGSALTFLVSIVILTPPIPLWSCGYFEPHQGALDFRTSGSGWQDSHFLGKL